MKTCPYCGEEIQNTAKKCRYCGERLYKKNNNTELELNTKKNREKISLTIFYASLAFLFILLVFTFMTTFGEDLGSNGSDVLIILGCFGGLFAVGSLLSFVICKIWGK